MEAVKSTLLLTALNANRLHMPIIRKTLVEWNKENMIQLYAACKRHTLDSKIPINLK